MEDTKTTNNEDLNKESNVHNESSSDTSKGEDNIKATSIPNNYRNQPRSFTSHGVELFQTAIPYVDNKTKKNINMFIKFTELANTFREYREPDEVSICEANDFSVDTESMLVEMRAVCTQREQEFVDLVINFLKAKKLYSSYQILTTSSYSPNSNSKDNSVNMFGLNSNPNMMEMLLSLLPPDQKSTFETLSMIMSTMN